MAAKMASEEAPAVGIDLGTTYSCIAVYRNGRADIILNEEGNRVTPSCVAFTNTERHIGDEAKRQEAMNAENTIFDAKRLIGRTFDDPLVQADIENWPFKVINVDGKPMIQVMFKKEKKVFSPEEVSSMVLTKMKGIAEDFLRKPVKNAVITVPAYFNNAQRQATKDAGTIAGLNVLRVLNEPTAAALAYGTGGNSEDEHTVLIFDLGGGTFDVTVLCIEEGIFEVKATTGDTHLGGADFDNRMILHFVEEFSRKFQKDLKTDKKAISRLRNACERAKRSLSTSNQANIALDFLHKGIDFHSSITRARFEELCGDLFKSTIDIVKKALSDAQFLPGDIREVVLVGGSTRIPMVRSLVQDFFGGKMLNQTVNPDEAIAYGAAVQAAIIEGDESEDLQDIVLVDVIPLTIGINVVGGMMAKVIERNTSVPKKIKKTFSTATDNQRDVLIQVFEGERVLNMENNLLGKFVLDDIPPAPRGIPQIEVTFEIDSNGILNVTAVETKNNKSNQITIKNDEGRLSKEDIEKMIKAAEKYKKEDDLLRETVTAKNELEYYCFSTKSKLEDPTYKIKDPDREAIINKCKDTIKWLDTKPTAKKEDYDRKLKDLKKSFTKKLETSTIDPKK